MKKLLLVLVASIATLGVSAQTWTKQFTPVSSADDLGGVHTAITADGTVYVSSTYNQEFTFAGRTLAAPEDNMTSAIVVKYDAKGEEKGDIRLEGGAIITDLTADEDNNFYAVGTMTGKVIFHGAEGATELNSDDVNISAFVLKVSADGKLLASKIITSAADQTIQDSWMYYPEDGDVYVTPTKVQVDNGKVYVAANYTGDIAELGWEGAYLDVAGFMYMDNRSAGVFSLDAADLGNAASIAYVGLTNNVSDAQNYPEALSFAAKDGQVSIGYFGFGNLTINTPENDRHEEIPSGQHSFIFTTIQDGIFNSYTIFSAPAHYKDARPYKVLMSIQGNNAIISGTYYGALPFDNSLTTGEVSGEGEEISYSLSSAAFVASVNRFFGIMNWAKSFAVESKAVTSVATDDYIALFTNTGSIMYDLTGNAQVTTSDVAAAVAVAGEKAVNVSVDDTKVIIKADVEDDDDDTNAISGVDAETATKSGVYMENGKIVIVKDGKKFNTAGQLVD